MKKVYLVVYIVFMIYNIFMLNGCNNSNNDETPGTGIFVKDIDYTTYEGSGDYNESHFNVAIPNYNYDQILVDLVANVLIRDTSRDSVIMGDGGTHWEIDDSFLNFCNIKITEIYENLTYHPDGNFIRASIRKRISISRVNDAIAMSNRKAIPLKFYCKIRDKLGDSLLYNQVDAKQISLIKNMQIELDYTLYANALIDSINYWNEENDIWDWVLWDTLYNDLQSYFPYGINLNKHDTCENWTFVNGSTELSEYNGGFYGDHYNPSDSSDTALYRYSLGCHNSAEEFRKSLLNNEPMIENQWSSHLILVDSIYSPIPNRLDTTWITGKSLKTNGNFYMEWPYTGDLTYYNNFSFVTVVQFFWVLYDHNYDPCTWTTDSLIEFNRKFVKALAVLSAHELGHNTGCLNDINYTSRFDVMELSLSVDIHDIDTYLWRSFNSTDVESIKDSSQFYFLPIETKKGR